MMVVDSDVGLEIDGEVHRRYPDEERYIPARA
jgi:hypothetical protein